MSNLRGLGVRVLILGASVAAPAGCRPEQMSQWDWKLLVPASKAQGASRRKEVPYPINLLLPEEIKIDSFTGTRTFDKAGGIRGIDVRVKALDAYGDVTKAFGKFRFELYRFRANNTDPKGDPLGLWHVDLSEPRVNVRHWSDIPPGYKFRLKWSRSIPVGKQFVLVAVFSSPFTERLFDQRVFVSGQ